MIFKHDPNTAWNTFKLKLGISVYDPNHDVIQSFFLAGYDAGYGDKVLVFEDPSLLAVVKETRPQIICNIEEVKCSRCGNEHRFPVIPRQRDILQFERIVKVANHYCKEQGLYEAIMYDTLIQCVENIAFNDGTPQLNEEK